MSVNFGPKRTDTPFNEVVFDEVVEDQLIVQGPVVATSFTAAAPGSPSTPDAAPGIVYAKSGLDPRNTKQLFAQMGRNWPLEQGIPILMASPPPVTISASGAASGLAGSLTTYLSLPGGVVSPLMTPMGGPAGPDTQFHNVAQIGVGWSAPATWTAWEIITDSPDFEWVVIGFGQGIRVSVNEQILTAHAVPLTAPGNDGGTYRVRVTCGTRTMRRHRIEYSNGSSHRLYGVTALTTDTIAPGVRRGPRVILMTDSFGADAGAVDYLTTYPQTLAWLTGWDIWPNAIGGSGYTVAGSGVAATAHIGDVTNYSPDLVIWFYGLNDNPTTPATIQAAATTCFQTTATALPRIPQIVLGPTADPLVNFTGTGAATWAGIRNAIQAAAAAVNGCIFADPYGTGFLRGTGHLTGATGDGNADFLVHSDAVHPSQAGHDALARVCAAVIASALAG